MAVGAVIGKRKMAKHFELTIEDARFTFRRKEDEIAAEARLDGLYVIRTSLPKEAIGAGDAVSAYKSLSQVERAFRSLKSVDLEIHPMLNAGIGAVEQWDEAAIKTRASKLAGLAVTVWSAPVLSADILASYQTKTSSPAIYSIVSELAASARVRSLQHKAGKRSRISAYSRHRRTPRKS